MYLGAVDRSAEQLDELQHAMARVQQDRDEDLVLQRRHPQSQALLGYRRIRQRDPALQALVDEPSRGLEDLVGLGSLVAPATIAHVQRGPGDRKGVVEGKSVSRRVELGDRRRIKKKKNRLQTT